VREAHRLLGAGHRAGHLLGRAIFTEMTVVRRRP
jgi:hypothetical protein